MKELREIENEFLKYAPSYAKAEAELAIQKIIEIKAQGLLREGVYYIVHIDLVDSTKFASENGNEALKDRIQLFQTACISAITNANIHNISVFLKEIGDAALVIFSHFPDILKWKFALDNLLKAFSSDYHVRVCVHLGEVALQGVNPLSIAVSQTFKMDKYGISDEIVLSNHAFLVAWPTLARAYYAFQKYDTIDFEGCDSPVDLHRLIVIQPATIKQLAEEAHDRFTMD